MPKAKAPRELELKYRFRFRVLDLIGSTLNLLVPWGSLVLIAFMIADALKGLSGRTTLADIGVKFLIDIRMSEAIAYVLAAGGMAYGYKERRLRQKNIPRLSARNQELERRIDPGRSTSGLTP